MSDDEAPNTPPSRPLHDAAPAGSSEETAPRRGVRGRSGTAAVLANGERIVRTAAISTGIYWKAIVALGIAIVLLLFPLVFNLALLMLFVSILTFIAAWMTRHYLLLMLTDRRVVLRYGVLALETVQIHYDKIESVELAWTPMGRLLGYATVLITGTGSRISAIPFVANAVSLRAEFDTMLTRQEDKVVRVHIETPAERAADTP